MQTRFVDVSLYLELSKIDNDDFLQVANDSFIKSKLNNIDSYIASIDGVNEACPAVIKILSEVYRKLDKIESIINQNEKDIAFSHKALTQKLGHGVLTTKNIDLEVDKRYYLKLNLTKIPFRSIYFFGEAIEKDRIKITKMHQEDVKDYDKFIVSVERESLRLRKISIGG